MEKFPASDLRLFMNALDKKSRKIIWYFRYHKHARLDELTELIGASAHMETLYRLKKVINPAAARILGRPLLEFCESRIDRKTGKRVLFSWWLSDFLVEGRLMSDEREKPLIDVFDEIDRIIILYEVSPVLRLSDKVKVEQRQGILSITLEKIQ